MDTVRASVLVDELSVDGRMYMASGEVNLGVIKGVMCFYFNKNLIEEYQLESPYDLVNSGEWTLDKFNEMAQVGYSDLNGDTKINKDDQFGFIISNENHAPNFVLASGQRLTSRDDDGMPYYSLGEERTVDIISKMQKMMTQDGFMLKEDTSSDYANTFVEGRALFQTGEFQYAANYRATTFRLRCSTLSEAVSALTGA